MLNETLETDRQYQKDKGDEYWRGFENGRKAGRRNAGRWVKPKGMMPPEFHGCYACSNCGGWALMQFRMVPYKQVLSNFCPHCGSRMKGGVE